MQYGTVTGRFSWWRSPSGATEDRNTVLEDNTVTRDLWRSPSGATGDRTTLPAPTLTDRLRGGGRPPVRPRIATSAVNASAPSTRAWRSPSGATEDRNNLTDEASPLSQIVAVALRGDRGSQRRRPQLRRPPHQGGGRPPGRPRIATTRSCARSPPATVAVALRGDRGSQPRPGDAAVAAAAVAVALRGDRGSQPRHSRDVARRRLEWRSPSGATEDRNGLALSIDQQAVIVAVALRGDRGSQPLRSRNHGQRGRVAVALRGDRGSQRAVRPYGAGPTGRGGRPPGRPRIATTGSS